MTTFSRTLRARWVQCLLVAAPVCGAFGCGADFDPSQRVNSLRVFGVQKDLPYAPPTVDPSSPTQVQMTMLSYDGLPSTRDEPRPIQRLWFSGCDNLPGDQYFTGLARIFLLWQLWTANHPGEQLQEGESWSPVDDLPIDALVPYLALLNPSLPVELAEAYFRSYRIGAGERFTYPIPPRIIEGHANTTDPNIPPYGLAFVFCTVCAGHSDVAPEWKQIELSSTSTLRDATLGFPFLCIDDTGKPRDSDGYVAGYTQQYVYGDGSANLNPAIAGVKFNGTAVEPRWYCLDGDCVPDSSNGDDPCEAGSDAPRVKACSDHCPEYELLPELNPLDNDDIDAFTSASGNPVGEQMWINYYSNRGEFDGPARSLRATTLGWFDDHGEDWKPPPEEGPALLWAVVHDNRGGTAWLRVQVCVEPK